MFGLGNNQEEDIKNAPAENAPVAGSSTEGAPVPSEPVAETPQAAENAPVAHSIVPDVAKVIDHQGNWVATFTRTIHGDLYAEQAADYAKSRGFKVLA